MPHRGRSNNGNHGAKMRRDKRLAIYLRDGFQCVYCGADLHRVKPFQLTLDHLKPFNKGGLLEPSNLVTACRACNCGRQEQAWKSYATPGAIKRIKRNIRRALPRELAKAILRGDEADPRS